MYKVMIVDDESLIISLIENLIDWEKYDMVVAGSANNGIDALTEVERIQPDIVIVDVRMPGYDGITFMQKLREINTKIKFIVISGHKKFEYAKSAMKYNVEDYLIKPINKEEMEHILDKLRQKLASERQSENMHQALSSELNASHRQIHDYFIESFFQNKLPAAGLSEDTVNGSYFTKFRSGCYCGIILKLDSRYTRLDSGFTETLLGRIQEQFLKIAADLCHEILIQPAPDCLRIICNYPDERRQEVPGLLKEIFSYVSNILKKFEDILLTIGIGAPVHKLSDASSSLLSADSCIQARIALGTQRLIFYSDLKEDPGIIQIILTNTAMEKWNDALRSLRADNIKMQLLNLFSYAEDYKYQDNLIYNKVALALHRKFYDYIVKIDLCKKTYEEFENELKEDSCWAFNGRMFADALSEQMASYITQYISEDSQDCNPAIRIAKKYIAENYQSNISMTSMAELVNLSPVYFSVLFKREVGTNFLDYLNQYRLEVSKKLLRQVKYNINEVASLSGFQDSKYFSKLFKKTFGITPSDYRNRNAG